MMEIYFDHAATTKPYAPAVEAACEAFAEGFGNPSSAHACGERARGLIDEAAKSIAQRLGVPADSLVFTSGGTEANNLAVFGSCASHAGHGRASGVVTNMAEHPSVTESVNRLRQKGFAVTYTPLGTDGAADLSALEQAVNADTALVSLMLVNNETGVLQDIETAGKMIKKRNQEAVFHVDCVQGLCKRHLNLSNVDICTISAHKVHGIKGVGACIVKKGIRLTPLLYGGGQQRGLRPGTENTAGIAAFAAAVNQGFDRMDAGAKHVKALKDRFLEGASTLGDVYVNGGICSPYIANVSFKGVKAEVLLNALSQRGIYVSTGAACHRGSRQRNILNHYGLPGWRVDSALRFSFSAENTLAEVDLCLEALAELTAYLRAFSKGMPSGRNKTGVRKQISGKEG